MNRPFHFSWFFSSVIQTGFLERFAARARFRVLAMISWNHPVFYGFV